MIYVGEWRLRNGLILHVVPTAKELPKSFPAIEMWKTLKEAKKIWDIKGNCMSNRSWDLMEGRLKGAYENRR